MNKFKVGQKVKVKSTDAICTIKQIDNEDIGFSGCSNACYLLSNNIWYTSHDLELMMNADELFEELGYEKYFEIEKAELDEVKVGYKKILYNGIVIKIDFCGDGTFGILNSGNGTYYVSMQELQAINKKYEELGWI